MAIIKDVGAASPFYGKVLPGDNLIRINNKVIQDVLDYMFFSQSEDEFVTITILRDGQERVYTELCNDGNLYIEFENYLMDTQRSCRNKCVFCFIDQLPKGMRDSLYYKDDDFRLSLLYGNYVTMTNVSDEELKRIVDLRISPLNISIHTTNPELRVKMMANPRAAKIMDILHLFKSENISFKGQIVLCPGLNDGIELERTLSDLKLMYPQLTSVSVVPLGMTKYRDGLFPLVPFTRESAVEAIQLVNKFGEQCMVEFGTRLFYVADELYQKAEMPLPGYAYYEEFEQYENGVGMIISYAQEFHDIIETLAPSDNRLHCSMITGVAAYALMKNCFSLLNKKFPNIQCDIHVIKNDFFGEQITVTGLITGQDVIKQLVDKELGSFLIVSEGMLRDRCFLDDVTVQDIQDSLHIPVYTVPTGAEDLIGFLLGQAGIQID